MKRILLTFGFVIWVAAVSFSQKTILVNPGTFYLKGIHYLTENKIINLTEPEYLLVFYEHSEISAKEAENYIRENNIKNMSIAIVKGNLTIKNVYTENDCSDEFRKLTSETDGIIFLGGWDLPPAFYGQQTSLLTQIRTPNRHLFELSYLFHLMGGSQNLAAQPILHSHPKYPVLGICLGMQTMNVAAGGDMYQDIPSEIYGVRYFEDAVKLDADQQHRNYWININTDELINNHSFHHIKFVDNDLAAIFQLKTGEAPYVCSSHHQAVHTLGQGMQVAATSADGKVIEALTHATFPNVLGVQFHPEFYNLHAPDAPKQKTHPRDKRLMSEHEILTENNSYEFHKRLWAVFVLRAERNYLARKEK